MAAFTHRVELAENIEVGKTLSVLESAIGNLVPVICLGFFNTAVIRLAERSPGHK